MKLRKLSFLFMLMFVLVLAACNGKESDGDAKPEENKEPEEKVEEPAAEEETYDLGGRVIKIANHWNMTPEGGTEIGDLTVERWKEVEEKYNVKIEWVEVPWEEKVNQLTSTILAGEPFADIVGLDSAQTASMVQQDYIYALDDIVDPANVKMSEGIKALGNFNGKLYMMNNQLNQSGGLYYNKTMFEQAGLPDPYELQQNGEWTWEAMLEAAKKLTSGDTYGLSGDPNLMAEYFISTNDAQILDTDTGEVLLDSSNAMEGLEFMASLYNEHKVIKPNEGNNWEDPRRYFTEGVVGMTQGWVWEAEGRAETSFEWGYVFWPKGPKATDNVTVVSNTEGLIIPKGVEDPEIVYQIWEDMQLWEYEREGVVEWFEQVLPNEESVDTATLMLDNIKANYWQAYGLQETFYETFDNIASGAESPTQAVDKIKGEAQATVDEFMGK